MSFNPLVGHLPSATEEARWFDEDIMMFQSLGGTSTFCDSMRSSCKSSAISMFQSLGGKSIFCDTPTDGELSEWVYVLIPWWEIYPLRHSLANTPANATYVFQSLRGKSTLCDGYTTSFRSGGCGFNPLVGNLPSATSRAELHCRLMCTFQSPRGKSTLCDQQW